MTKPNISEATARPVICNLDPATIEGDSNQPRTRTGKLDGLKESIKAHGILSSIIVSALGEGRYRIIAGHRRHSAALELRLPTIPAIVRSVKEQQRLELQLVENIHREDLSVIDEARAFKRLIEEFDLTQKDLAARVGKSNATINQTLRVLDLPKEILDDLNSSEPPNKSVLLEIAKAPVEQQQALWKLAKKGQLTVQRARGTLYQKQSLSRRVKLGYATVTIRFRKGMIQTPGEIASQELMCKTLKEAMARVKSLGSPCRSSGSTDS